MNPETATTVTVGCIGVLMAVSFYLPLAIDDLFIVPLGSMEVAAFGYGYGRLHGVSLPVAFLIAVVLATALALVAGTVLLRLSGWGAALGSLAIVELVSEFFINFKPTGASLGLLGVPYFLNGPVVLAITAVVVVLLVFSEFLRPGAVMRALHADKLAAACSGINVNRTRLVVYTLSGGVAGLAGAMLAGLLTIVSPDQFGLGQVNQYLAGAILGGSATVLGPAAGGAASSLAPNWLSFLQRDTLLAYAVIVLVVVLLRPQGLITERLMLSVRKLVARTRRGRRRAEPLAAGGAGTLDLPDPLTLSVRDLRKRFGGVRVLEGISLDIAAGSITALVGPNGAGKSTLINILSGVVRADAGTVAVGGRLMRRVAPHRAVRLGLARTFQNLRLFNNMTVEENVSVVGGRGWPAVLEEVNLTHAVGRPAGELPYGEQRRLEIARALATRPGLLLLDEPAAGMSTAEAAEVVQLIRRLSGEGMTIFLVDHNMDFIAAAADRVIALDGGELIADGTFDELVVNPRVVSAYLGERPVLPLGA